MTDIKNISDFIKKINKNCSELETLESKNKSDYESEKKSIENQSKDVIKEMEGKYTEFKENNFYYLKKRTSALVELLSKDYSEEWKKSRPNPFDKLGEALEETEFSNLSYNDKIQKVYELIAGLNSKIKELNIVDFDALVPPVMYEMKKPKDEFFNSYTGNHENIKKFDCSSSAKNGPVKDTAKPIKALVKEVFSYCDKIDSYIDKLIEDYDKEFNIEDFKSHVKKHKEKWLSNVKSRQKKDYTSKFDSFFNNEKETKKFKEFFEALENEGEKANVDVNSGSTEYKKLINIGDLNCKALDKETYYSFIKNNEVLSREFDNSSFKAPFILDLKKCGNVMLNIDEDVYSDETMNFVNQLIIQYLLSFPANRINFCLIDIDNKMNFSQFKSLTKINNNIIRDDRQLENTIKDMEQTMYKINDDVLSYNSVEDIYEYNSKFDANPQNMNLFVIVNYPSGMREDTAKRIMKIIQNGNKAGIFTIIVNNKVEADKLSNTSYYKLAEYSQFIENAKKLFTVIDKKGDKFIAGIELENTFTPKSDNYVTMLPNIIDMLKGSAENNRQKVIPITQMFESNDAYEDLEKLSISSAEVLDIPIGARGGEIQNLLFKTTGDGSAHAVVIGGTGSGKSNLLHTIIMSVCHKYSPEDVNLYLVDFKGGVEFKFYEANKEKEKQIPHIKLTGLTSDLEDGLAILNNLHKELRRREDEFRKSRVEDIVQYRNNGNKMPRLFVIIDEIQELFEQDDMLGQKAIDTLRELFKKGRAFGINILWASQNIPNVPGLKDKVLSQIGNRISLRLNDPDDASKINIDPKVVKNLNRPEKGLGVINDIRYGNESIEFRVAYAETSETRKQYADDIINKWKHVTEKSKQEPLFIVGDDDEPSPVFGNTMYNNVPTKEQIIPKSFDNYYLELGQDYITGKPFNVELPIRDNKKNVIIAGYDMEILRDMMGYSLLSLIMNQMTNADCLADKTKIYYANGEMINPKNSNDLFNVIKTDFAEIIENVSSNEKMVSCIKETYKLYKERSLESDNLETTKVYTPHFVVIHSMQKYIDIFKENPTIKYNEETEEKQDDTADVLGKASSGDSSFDKLKQAMDIFASVDLSSISGTPKTENSHKTSNLPDTIFFSDAFKEVLSNGGKFGIHFIISIDNPLSIIAIKNEIMEISCKILTKGVNSNVVSQLLGDYKSTTALSNPKVALVSMYDERSKVRLYRYDDEQDSAWYKSLSDNYRKLWEND